MEKTDSDPVRTAVIVFSKAHQNKQESKQDKQHSTVADRKSQTETLPVTPIISMYNIINYNL